MMRTAVVGLLALALLLSSGCRRKKYENPITQQTEQPDKLLYDKALRDIEKGRYEVARLTLNTLINTYDSSEFLAKAKLAVADSWFREGGTHGLAQAEAEYKDFILFYPTLEEAAESQEKVCMIHYRQMEKADRDPNHALRAEDECRQLLVQFPNSKFAPRVAQLLRNIQEALAEAEMRVGTFYYKKGSYPAAANRLQALTDHYPLYSKADEALWELGEAYGRMGARFREKSGAAYAKIVREYPLSARVPDAKAKLQEMELPVPEADPVALARMKYELENRDRPGFMARSTGFIRRGPDMSAAAKSGTPAMQPFRPTIPASIPAAAGAAGSTGVTDVSISTVAASSSDLESRPDARQSAPATAGASTAARDNSASAPSSEPLPSNRSLPPAKKEKKAKAAKKEKVQK